MINIFFISQNNHLYEKYLNQFSTSLFNIVCIDLDWNDSISNWISKCEEEITIHINNSDKNYIIGHSIGASVALFLSSIYTFDKVFIYSPSPIFNELISFIDIKGLTQLGKNKIEEIKNKFSLFSIKDKIVSPIEIYVGENEPEVMRKISFLIKKCLKKTNLTILKNKHHHDLIDDHRIFLK